MDLTMTEAMTQAHIGAMGDAMRQLDRDGLRDHVHGSCTSFTVTPNGFEMMLAPPGDLPSWIAGETEDETEEYTRTIEINPRSMQLVLPDEGTPELQNKDSDGEWTGVTLSPEGQATLQQYAAAAWAFFQEFEESAVQEDDEEHDDDESDDNESDDNEDIVEIYTQRMIESLKEGMLHCRMITMGSNALRMTGRLTPENGNSTLDAMIASMHVLKALGTLGEPIAEEQIIERNRKREEEHSEKWADAPLWAALPTDYAKRAAELAVPVFEEIHMAAENPAKDIRPSPSPWPEDEPPAYEGKDLAQCLREMGQTLNAVHTMAKAATKDIQNDHPPQQAVSAAIEAVRTIACLALQLEPLLTTDEERLNAAGKDAPAPMLVGTLTPYDFLSS